MAPRGAKERIIVTDGETRAAVAACRGLAAAGFRVAAVAGTRPACAHWSLSCDEAVTLPHPLHQADGFIAGIERLVSSGHYSAIVPGGDASLRALSSERERTDPFVRAGLPSHDVVLASMSKLSLAVAAAEVGLKSPETAVCETTEDALAAAGRIGFPALLKPVCSLFDIGGAPARAGSVRVSSSEALMELAPAYGSPCLVQRAEEGRIVSFAGVFAGGRLLSTAVSRYLRTWYREAGNACYSQSIDPPAGLSERVAGLLEALRWQGLFELELVERPDETYAAIDMNPRVYGSLALAVGAGANLPAVWCDWLHGRERPATTARAGLRYRWEDADLRHALVLARNGDLRGFAAVCRPRRRTVHPHFRLRDPGPLVARALELGRLLAARRRRAPRAPIDPDVAQRPPRRAREAPREVAILGAGPYGLAAAAHLRQAGIPVRMFGRPLEFWRTQMPEGMILRSRRRSTHIAHPRPGLKIDDFEAASGRRLRRPTLTLEEFIDYGLWFQQQAAPELDTRRVRVTERTGEAGFRLQLEDSDELVVDRLVVAAGLFPFARRPEPFASLPDALVSHSADHRDLSGFAGRRVLVVGGGQSALESAALLHERGAAVEVALRGPGVHWLNPEDGPPRRDLRSRLPLPPTDVGGFTTGWTAAIPSFWRALPGRVQPTVSYRCIRPAGSDWLRPRLEDVRLVAGAAVTTAAASNGGVRVTFGDGRERSFDRVLLGTGYAIDVRAYPFLAPELAREIEVENGYPRLGPGLESSVPGLHFLGAPAALSFGPIMRFVVGSWYAAPALTRRLQGRRQAPLQPAFPRR